MNIYLGIRIREQKKLRHSFLIVNILCHVTLQNLHWKLGQQSAIYWNFLGLFRDYGLNHIFFRNKTFLFFQHRKLKFSTSIWKKKNRETSQKFQLNALRQFLFPFFLSVVWLSLNFLRFHKLFFQTDAENVSFLSWKTKNKYLKNIQFRP